MEQIALIMNNMLSQLATDASGVQKQLKKRLALFTYF